MFAGWNQLTSSNLIARVSYGRHEPLLRHYNGLGNVSNHQPHDCLLNRLYRRRSKKTSKLCVTGLCVWNSPETGEFPAQMASITENFSIWWRHHAILMNLILDGHVGWLHNAAIMNIFLTHIFSNYIWLLIHKDYLYDCKFISVESYICLIWYGLLVSVSPIVP